MACAQIGKEKFYGIDNIYGVLKEWYDSRGEEVQIDGNTSKKSNKKAWIFFVANQNYYKLNGDTKDVAVKSFMDAFDQNKGEFDAILVVDYTERGTECLRLVNGESFDADGWYCYKV